MPTLFVRRSYSGPLRECADNIFADNGDIAVLWLGNAVSPQILRDLYDVESTEELNTRMVSLA